MEDYPNFGAYLKKKVLRLITTNKEGTIHSSRQENSIRKAKEIDKQINVALMTAFDIDDKKFPFALY